MFEKSQMLIFCIAHTMSVVGQSPTWRPRLAMSPLPLKADIDRVKLDVG
jgi:hypothetical protein